MAYLDETGLARLWSKVKDYVDAHSGGGGSIPSSSQTLSVSSEFELYTSGENIICNRYGNVVSVTGIVKPKSDIAGAITRHTICTVPSGLRPSAEIHVPAHGSGNAEWLLSVLTTGEVQFSRYRNTGTASNSYIAANTSQWLPFHATWVIK